MTDDPDFGAPMSEPDTGFPDLLAELSASVPVGSLTRMAEMRDKLVSDFADSPHYGQVLAFIDGELALLA